MGAEEDESEIKWSPEGEGLIQDGVSLIEGPGVRCGWDVGAEECENAIKWSPEGEGLIQDGVSLIKGPGVRCDAITISFESSSTAKASFPP